MSTPTNPKRRAPLFVPAIAVVALAPEMAHAAPGGAPNSATSVSILEAFFIQRNPATGQVELFGSLIIWALLALSVVVLAMILRMVGENKRQRILPGQTHAGVLAALNAGDRQRAQRVIDEDPSYFSQVLGACLREAHAGYAPMLRALELATDEFTARRLRRIEPLHVIGSVAPMIGLFGTVYGMILAFREIVASGGSPDPVGLAAGIGTALTTTFWGLIVAIPALSAHALIRNTIDARTSEASLEIEDILSGFRPRRGAPVNGSRPGAEPQEPPDPGALIRAGAESAAETD
ncbi:MAG: MotA/TolQ/ExbB proton channel family protein [Phycisphaeraceae bacterium]|nr:MotA/TolQ/ExbB proton channel family protein [Phycisphaeraceae bacterium]